MRRNRAADKRAPAAVLDLEGAVVLRQAFIQPERHALRDVVDDEVHVLVKDRAQRFVAVGIGERDDVHVLAREEVASEFDGPAVEAGTVGFEGARRSEHDDDRRHGGRRSRARDHARECFAESFELVGDLPDAAFAGFAVDDEVGRLDAHPVGGPARDHGQQEAGDESAEAHGPILACQRGTRDVVGSRRLTVNDLIGLTEVTEVTDSTRRHGANGDARRRLECAPA